MASNPQVPFSFDPQSGELRSVWQFFDAAPVTAIGWHPRVLEGASVEEGMVLGSVQFEDGSQLDIRAPASCAGTLARINGAFRWGDADKSPSQVLMLIEAIPPPQ